MNTKKSNMLLGAHMSIEGGFEKAIERGAALGCNTIQIFTKSNRQWSSRPIDKKEAILFQEMQKKHSISPIIAHCSYLVNIGSPIEVVSKKSTLALIDELDRCNTLGIPYLVLHPGSALKESREDCIVRITKNLDYALSKSSGSITVLLETMAGQGSTIGTTFEEIAAIRNASEQRNNIGVCLDTCHVFAAGYSFTTKNDYLCFWDTFDKIIGLKHLKALHINDSKKAIGQHVDRHENIGSGLIGIDAFSFIINDKNLINIPKILETPKESEADDARNLEIIRNLEK